jgi:hypothetical protein
MTWNGAKVDAFRSVVDEFVSLVKIDSKELGGGAVLGDNIYRAQQMFLDTVFDALSDDIHDIYILKARQLGISTIGRALSLLWVGLHDGMKGAIVLDTGFNTQQARREILGMIRGLPKSFRFPRIREDNRDNLILENDSSLLFMQAGRSNAKSGGGLGRSVGLNFAHCSEISSFVNEEGLVSFRQSLAQNYDDRLFIWESTPRGYNSWHAMWEDAKDDDLGKRCAFFGWWAKDTQELKEGTPEFERYAQLPPAKTERDRMRAVKELYGWDITPGQLAWYRKLSDPSQEHEEGDAEDSLILQEQGWTENECFQATGSMFFDSDSLSKAANRIGSLNLKPQQYKFVAGNDFVGCDIRLARTRRETELRVWEEPAIDGTYVLAADPAFGRDENNNHSAASVLRCYADGLDQVAEFASPLCPPHHFAWLLMSLAGWYGGTKPGCKVLFMCELNGPGEEVWRQYQASMLLVQRGYLRRAAAEKGISDIYTNARSYIYSRSDQMSGGHNYQWKSTGQNKVQIMEACRNYLYSGGLIVNSMEALEEMKSVSREGDVIGAEGKNRDDRTFALALGVRGWEEKLMRPLVTGNRTRQAERARLSMSIVDQRQLYETNMLQSFFRDKHERRRQMMRAAQSGSWRRAARPTPVGRR